MDPEEGNDNFDLLDEVFEKEANISQNPETLSIVPGDEIKGDERDDDQLKNFCTS